MRLKIENLTDRPDAVLIPLAEYAATFFPHRPGTVRVTFKRTKKRWYGKSATRGVCYNSQRCVIWVERADCGMEYPKTYDQMHYFRHANHETVKPLTAQNWHEYCLAVIAHEMEHTTKRDDRMRRSRQEIHAWNRGVEVVEASRSPEAQAFLKQRSEEIVASGVRKLDKAAFKKSPEYKRIQCEALLQKWARKQKLAQTKIRKLKTRINYFTKREAAAATKAAGV